MKRRDFLKKAGVTTAAAAAATTLAAPAVHAEKKFRWKMVTTWPPRLPYLQTGAELFAKLVDQMSGGRLKIKVYAGGELIPALGCFDAVSKGTYQCYSGAAYYWAGKTPAAQWFAAVPFGMNAQGMYSWMWGGGGQKLYEEIYAPFNLIPRAGGNTGVQMGGWFNKKINTLDDYKGLKMRIPGLGGKVVAAAGGTVVLTPGGEIFTSLERGVIDATEWVGPLHDKIMGFYKAAKYYYYPGWHEPGTCLEIVYNKQAYEKLPKDLQQIVDQAVRSVAAWTLAGFDSDNGAALQELITKYKVQLIEFPSDVMKGLKKLSAEVINDIASKDKTAKKVNDAFNKFRAQVGVWHQVSEKSYYNQIAQKFSLKG